MTTGADVVDWIGTTTTMWDLRGDGIPDLRAASSTRKTMTIYEIGAERKAECDIYDKLSATIDVVLDLIARCVGEHLEGGGGVTWGAVRGRMGQRQRAAATITTMTTMAVSTTEEGELSGGGDGNDMCNDEKTLAESWSLK
jgi:hypothetical protein